MILCAIHESIECRFDQVAITKSGDSKATTTIREINIQRAQRRLKNNP
jgi:hypothetical protein